MKKTILLIILLLLIIVAGSLIQPKDNCTHLTGADYDNCHMLEVRGR